MEAQVRLRFDNAFFDKGITIKKTRNSIFFVLNHFAGISKFSSKSLF